jgi:hypothetical protein
MWGSFRTKETGGMPDTKNCFLVDAISLRVVWWLSIVMMHQIPQSGRSDITSMD